MGEQFILVDTSNGEGCDRYYGGSIFPEKVEPLIFESRELAAVFNSKADAEAVRDELVKREFVSWRIDKI